MQLTENELTALYDRDKRAVAIHEASHMVLIRIFGGLADARLWRNEGASIEEQRTWAGTCRVIARPGDLKFSPSMKKMLGIQRTPKHWALYVGLAGFLGELIDEGEEEWVMAEACWDALSDGGFSATDIAVMTMSDAQVTEHAIARTIEYLKRYWGEIQIEAGRLEGLSWCEEAGKIRA
jgi:hypothetical protein